MFLKHDARCTSKQTAARRPASWRRVRGLLVGCVLAGMSGIGGLAHESAVRAAQPADPIAMLMAAQQPMSNQDRYAKGVAEYKGSQYEEALADLQQVVPDQLSDKDKKDLDTYLKQADNAATQRKQARAEFELGEQSLAANKLPEAAAHYQAAMNNGFADDGTKAKSREQLAVSQSMMRQAGESMRDLYNQAVADYRAGNLESAKSRFTTLNNAGYRAGLFQRSPGDYLKEIDTKLAAAQPAPQAAPVVAPAPVPIPVQQQPAPVVQAPPPQPQPEVQAAPAAAAAAQQAAPVVQQPAPAPAPVVAQNPPPPVVPAPAPVVPQNPPPPAVVAPAAAAPVVAQNPPAPAPAPVVAPAPAPVVAPAAVPVAPAAPAIDAKTAYRMARDEYRSGDWISARKNFELAQDLGYKPGMFERAPSKYLADMDAKEQKDAALAASRAAAGTGAAAGGAMTAAELQNQQDRSRAEAVRLVAQAETARSANRLDESLALYMRAAELDPNNTAAVRGRDELAQLLNRQGAPSLLNQTEVRIQQQRDSIKYSFDTNIGEARNQIGAQDFVKGQAAIERARVARNENPGVFRDDELRQFDATLAQTQQSLDSASLHKQQQDAETARIQSQQELERRNAVIAAEKERTIADLTRQARQLTNQQDYERALGVIDQILRLDPNNEYAQGARPLVADRASLDTQRRLRERYDTNVVKWYTAAEEAKIPYIDIIRYPDNWPDLRRRATARWPPRRARTPRTRPPRPSSSAGFPNCASTEWR